MNLSKIRTLTSVNLADCSAITNNAMQVLSALTNLRHLSFVRCRRITEKGLEFVQSLPALHSLAVFGCSKVGCQISTFMVNLQLGTAYRRPTDASRTW